MIYPSLSLTILSCTRVQHFMLRQIGILEGEREFNNTKGYEYKNSKRIG